MAPRMNIGVPIAGGVEGVKKAFPGQPDDNRLNDVMNTLGQAPHDLKVGSLATPTQTNQFDIRL